MKPTPLIPETLTFNEEPTTNMAYELVHSSLIKIVDGGRVLHIESDPQTILLLERSVNQLNQLIFPFPKALTRESELSVEEVEQIAKDAVPKHQRVQAVNSAPSYLQPPQI